MQRNPPRRSDRPFRGPTPKGVFQTVDLMSGGPGRFLKETKTGRSSGFWVVDNSMKFPRRNYAFADKGIRRWSWFVSGNRTVYAGDIHKFLSWMAKNKIKTRHINIEMPRPRLKREMHVFETEVGFDQLFEKALVRAKSVLYPNGKIFVTSEEAPALEAAASIAKKYGFSVRAPKSLSEQEKQKRSEFTRRYIKSDIRLLELTYGLKTAFPKKKVRKKWPFYKKKRNVIKKEK